MKNIKFILCFISCILFQNLFGQLSEKKRAIIEAVKIATLEVVKEKIQTAENANVKDRQKVPILMWAIYLKDLETVKFLVEKGADIHVKAGLDIDKTSYYGNNLGIAAAENKPDILKYLIETCKIPVDDREFNPDDQADSGWTALEWACSKNNFEIVKYLVSQKAQVSIDGELPLKLAIETGNIEMIEFLLAQGAKPNTKQASPLYYATFYQNFEVVKLLLAKGANINSKTNTDETVFQFALQNGYLDIAQYLLEKGAESNTMLSDGTYPIHTCAKNGYLDILKLLVKNGVNVNQSSQKNAYTPLMYSAYNNQLNIAKFLITKGADKNLQSAEKQTALDFAKGRKDPSGNLLLLEMIKYLEEDTFTPLSKWQEMNQEIVMFINAQQYSKAIQIAQNTVDFVIKKHKKGSKEHGQALLNLGRLQGYVHNYKARIETYRKCLEIYKKYFDEESPEFQEVYYGLADVYFDDAQYQKTIDMYEPLPKHSTQNIEINIKALKLLASTYYRMGKYIESEKTCEKILKLRSQNILDKTFSYTLLGNIYQNMGKYTQANEKYTIAFEIYNKLSKEESKQYSGISHVKLLGNMTNLAYAMGKYTQAEYQYDVVLKNLESLEETDSPDYANMLSSQASMYMDLGRYEESLTKFKQAIKLKKELYGELHPSYATTLNNMTDLFLELKRYKYSEELYKKVLKIKAETIGKSHVEYAITLNNLGQLYAILDKNEEALKCYKESLEIQKKNEAENEVITAIILRNMAYIYQFQKKEAKALELFKECYKIRKKTLDSTHIDYPKILGSIATSYNRLGKYKEAESYFLRTNQLFRDIKQNMYLYMSENDRLDFDKTLKDYQNLFKIFAMNRVAENPKIIIPLFENELNSKAIILENTGFIKNKIYESGDTLQIKQYEKWQKYRDVLGKIARMSRTEIERESINQDLIKKEINQLEKNLSLYIAKPTIHHWEEVQKQLKPKEAIVEIIQLGYDEEESDKKTVYAALILKKKQAYPEFVLIDKTGQLDGKFFKYYQNAIKYKRKDKYSYDKYWAKIQEKLEGVRKVYISPAGIYNKVSFYSLQNPKTDTYLIDDLEVQLVNSSRDVLKEENSFQSSNQDMIFFGYPIYNLKEKEHLESVRNFREGLENTNAENISTKTTSKRDLQKAKYNQTITLGLLPGTKREVEKIHTLVTNKGFKAQKYIGKNALEESIKVLKSPRVLHIATHGFFLSDVAEENLKERIFGIQNRTLKENPLLRSGVLLTGAERHLNEFESSFELEDGILTAYEASNLQLLGTDLVVLSACETGLGTVQNGEGVYGLQRAFLMAGAKAIIMSLWQVDDSATQKLMELFYQRWAETNDKRASFLWAKKELRKEFPEPYYWSAFVMVGN